jgi:hypothetical protein
MGGELTLEGGWTAALRDADLTADDVLLYPHDAAPPNDGPTAIHVPPGVLIFGKDAAPLPAEQRQHAADNYGHHQILLHIDDDPDVLTAKLRHELEHVRQWQEARDGKGLFQVYQAIGCAMDMVIGRDPAKRRGSGVIYNIVPMEIGANAAASRFIRPLVDAQRLAVVEAGESANLFRRQPEPEPPEGEGLRMLCSAAILATQIEDAFKQGNHPNGRLGPIAQVVDGGETIWATLREDDELARCREEFVRAVPNAPDIDAAAPTVGHAWLSAREAWLRAYDRARAVAGLPRAPHPPGLPRSAGGS